VNDLTPIIIAFLLLFQIYPLLRMFNAWLVDKTISGRMAFFTLSVHTITIIALWRAGTLTYLLIYLIATSLLWLLSPLLSRIGEATSMRQMREEDLQRYQRLLAVDPRNAAAHAAIADIHLERGRLDEAIAGYQRAIEASPEHAQREQRLLQQVLELRDQRRRHRSTGPAPAPLADTMLSLPPAPPAPDAPPAQAENAEPEARPAVEPPPEPAWHWYDGAEGMSDK